VLGSGAPLVSQLPALAAGLRGMTTQLTQLTPQAGQLIDSGRQLLSSLVPLLNSNAKGIAALLANFGTLTTGLDSRIPALTATLGSTAHGLSSFAGIFLANPGEPGVTDSRGTLVTTMGPVCYYGTPRRTPQQVGPRPVQAGWSCVGDQQYLQQRGSVNAPIPGNGSTPAPAATPPAVQQTPSAGRPDSWTSILTVGG
jgi:phospholipid/cholesterol/gamma-HCH transport system substrate-binding protein